MALEPSMCQSRLSLRSPTGIPVLLHTALLPFLGLYTLASRGTVGLTAHRVPFPFLSPFVDCVSAPLGVRHHIRPQPLITLPLLGGWYICATCTLSSTRPARTSLYPPLPREVAALLTDRLLCGHLSYGLTSPIGSLVVLSYSVRTSGYIEV